MFFSRDIVDSENVAAEVKAGREELERDSGICEEDGENSNTLPDGLRCGPSSFIEGLKSIQGSPLPTSVSGLKFLKETDLEGMT